MLHSEARSHHSVVRPMQYLFLWLTQTSYKCQCYSAIILRTKTKKDAKTTINNIMTCIDLSFQRHSIRIRCTKAESTFRSTFRCTVTNQYKHTSHIKKQDPSTPFIIYDIHSRDDMRKKLRAFTIIPHKTDTLTTELQEQIKRCSRRGSNSRLSASFREISTRVNSTRHDGIFSL